MSPPGGEESADATPVGRALQAMDLAGRAMELAGLAAAAAGYALGSKAVATRRAYKSDWAHFAGWCAMAGLQALPADPATLALYLTAHAGGLKVSTLQRRLASISQAHKAEGLASPVGTPAVKAVWGGIARAHGGPPVRKTPLVVEAMRACLDQLDDTVRGRRDRALLLLAWGGALRRSEVVGLRCGDVQAEDRGLIITVRKSKTDQLAAGRQIGIPYGRTPAYCPVRAYHQVINRSRTASSPLFVAIRPDGRPTGVPLSDKHVARLVKRVADAAGLAGDYSGHSLRAGFATAAAAAGASERSIMAQTGHKSLIIARGYIRPAQLFDDNAAAVAAL
jgi:integrase